MIGFKLKLVFVCAIVLLLGVTHVFLGDWDPGDGHKMHFPQLPDPDGWDVCLCCQWVADDFMCTETGLITDIHFWTSWKADDIGVVDNWDISIWSDAPGWPGAPLWNWNGVGTVNVRGPDTGLQGWICPSPPPLILPQDHLQYYQVNITNIDPGPEPFIQQDGTTYWLVIRANIPPEPSVGWKTSLDRFQNPALWSLDQVNWSPVETPELHDMAFVITNNASVEPKPPVPHLKWSQPPIEIDPTAYSPTYCGWDEISYNKDYQDPFGPWKLVADDFRCLGNIPVISVHWWGSHFDWENPEEMPPPENLPIAWQIGFWSNMPEGMMAPYSYPEMLLWQIVVPTERVQVEQVATDYYYGYYPLDVCYQYYLDLEPEEIFWQNRDQTLDDTFWLSIVALYPDPCEPPYYPWGWKTRPWSWMDDSVTFNLPDMPVEGMALDPLIITPIKDPVWLESFDVAFELDTDPNFIKWEQAYDNIRHWPHYWDELSMAVKPEGYVTKWNRNKDPMLEGGIDVDATIGGMLPPQILADDFLCEMSGPITDIHVWGSWLSDELPFGDDETAVTFTLSFHSDNPSGPGGWSEPNEPLWLKTFGPGEFIVEVPVFAPQDWFNPCTGEYLSQNHFWAYRYSFFIDPADAFWQEEGNIYWLDLQAMPLDGIARFGWKTSIGQWNDYPVYAIGEEPYWDHWELIDLGFDLAFEITTQKEPEIVRLVADDWQCERETPVTAIVWFGSYIDYGYEACTYGPFMPLPVKPDYFLLNIWTDVPAGPSFSHPGEIIWEYRARAFDYDEVLVGYDKNPHGEPNEPVFRYSVRLPEEEQFLQEEVNDIYWLSVVAVYDENTPNYDWGWTNHEYVFNDDAVAGTLTGDLWEWIPLKDQTGTREDMSFILFTEPDCINKTAPEYNEWVAWNKPDCWCYPRQCRGDGDGIKTGPFWVAIPDLNLFRLAFNKTDLVLAGVPMGICCDFDHLKTGPFRVAIPDLNIFRQYFNKVEALVPVCDQPPIYTGPYNFWTSP